MQKEKRPGRSPGRSDEIIAAITRDLQELEVLDECRSLAKKHGVLIRAALGSGRNTNVVLARDAIIEYLRGRFQYSTSEAGKLLRMDHTSVQESTRRTKVRRSLETHKNENGKSGA